MSDDEELRQRRLLDWTRRTQDFPRCQHCGGDFHGLPKKFITGEICHGSHEGSKGKTLDG